MKNDVKAVKEGTNTYRYSINDSVYREKVYPTEDKAFQAGLIRVEEIRADEQPTVYIQALPFATPEEIVRIDEMDEDQLQEIANRKHDD